MAGRKGKPLAKEMMLISIDDYNNLKSRTAQRTAQKELTHKSKSTQKRSPVYKLRPRTYRSPFQPYRNVMVRLEKQLQNFMLDPTLSTDDKTFKYSNVLARYLTIKD